MSREGGRNIKSWHAVAVLSGLVLLVYFPALKAPFNSVDDMRMVHHLVNRADFSWQDFVFPGASSYYRPLVTSSFIFDRIVWGLSAPIMHFENVSLHLVNTLLLFFLARQLCVTQRLNSLLLPFTAALIFGLHPINVEAVTWIAGRADVMVTFFILLTSVFFFRYRFSGGGSWLFFSLICFFLGTLAKETALFLMPGLLFLGWSKQAGTTFSSRSKHMSVLSTTSLLAPYACVVAGYFYLRSWALRGRDLGIQHVRQIAGGDTIVSLTNNAKMASPEPITSVSSGGSLDSVEHVITVIGFYTKKLFWPFPLNFGIIDVSGHYFWLGLLLLLVTLVLLWWRTLSAGLLLTAMCLASISLLVAVTDISWTPIAERYMYAPSAFLPLGLMLGATHGLSIRSSRWMQLSLISLIAIFFVGTYQRNLVWQDNLALFTDTVEKSPSFAGAKNELAMALLARGERTRAFNIFRNLEQSGFQLSSLNKIMVLASEGDLSTAHVLLKERLKTPESYETEILKRLISVLERMIEKSEDHQKIQEYREEIILYLDTLWERSKDPFYLYRKGHFQSLNSDYSAAKESFERAASLLPDDSMYKIPASKLADSLR